MNERELAVLRGISLQLQRIGDLLEGRDQDGGPNYYRPLSEYPSFDWPSIGAQVVSQDEHGATVVKYRGREWKRRTRPKFGTEVWFSRANGRDEAGTIQYLRLITFTDDDTTVEPLTRQIVERLFRAPAPRRVEAPVEVETEAPEPESESVEQETASPTDFWTRYRQLVQEGRVAETIRQAPEVQAAIAGRGTWGAALARLEREAGEA